MCQADTRFISISGLSVGNVSDVLLFAFHGKTDGPILIKLRTKLVDIPGSKWAYRDLDFFHRFKMAAVYMNFCSLFTGK